MLTLFKKISSHIKKILLVTSNIFILLLIFLKFLIHKKKKWKWWFFLLYVERQTNCKQKRIKKSTGHVKCCWEFWLLKFWKSVLFDFLRQQFFLLILNFRSDDFFPLKQKKTRNTTRFIIKQTISGASQVSIIIIL